MTNRDSLSSGLTLPPLNYLHPSPVRGQLEPHNEATRRSGWRYLQCTDTPNELKVLLPPRTAQLYAVLLKAELNELAKERDASWERVLDIRRLKDRMIRKCQRLAQTYSSSNPGSRVPFLTLHAPHDFRLKEMEKWIRDQDGSDVLFKKSNGHPDGHKSRSAVWCDNCARQASHHHHTVSHRRSSSHVAHANTTHPRRSSSSRTHKSSSLRHRNFIEEDFVDGRSPSSPSASLLPLRESESQHVRVQGAQVHQRIHEHSSTKESSQSRHFSARQLDVEQEHLHLHASEHHQNASVEEGVFVEESKSHQRKRDMHVIQEERESSNLSILENHQESGLYGRAVASPVPLPVPYNGSMSSVFQDMVTSPVYADYPDTGSEQEQRLLTEGSRSPPSEEESVGDSLAPPGTLRRRSSLKRSNSDLRLNMAYSTKTVSWAMDRDWTQKMAKYQAAVEDVGFVDREWGIICDKYKEDLAGLKALRRNVTETLSKLRLETERLQREDEVIRDQEDKLRTGLDHLEQKHGHYRAKVKAVLHETEQVLALCGTKRDGEHRGS